MATSRLVRAVGAFGAAVLRQRLIVRAPIGLYRRGLGWLFGSRLCMIEHIGRSSGRARYGAVEVVEPVDGGVIVASGYGTRSQWYRNIVAEPRVRLSTGRVRSRSARAVPVPAAEAREALADYAHRHPVTWRFLTATFAAMEGGGGGTDPDAELQLVRILWV